MQGCRGIGIDANHIHKLQGILNTVSHILVLFFQRIIFHKSHIPAIHLVQIGQTTLGKSPKQVQRGCTTMVGLQHSIRVRHPGLLGKIGAIDNITTITG